MTIASNYSPHFMRFYFIMSRYHSFFVTSHCARIVGIFFYLSFSKKKIFLSLSHSLLKFFHSHFFWLNKIGKECPLRREREETDASEKNISFSNYGNNFFCVCTTAAGNFSFISCWMVCSLLLASSLSIATMCRWMLSHIVCVFYSRFC